MCDPISTVEHIEGTPVRLHVEVFQNKVDLDDIRNGLANLADTIEGIVEVPPLERHSYPTSTQPHTNKASWAFEFIFREKRNGEGVYNELLEIGWITGRLNVPYSTTVEYWEV